MNFVLIQGIFAVCFGLLLLRLATSAFRGEIPRSRAVIWAFVWSVGLVLVLNPKLSFGLARLLGVTRGTDAVTYTAIAFLSVMIFRAFQLLDAQDQQLSKMTTQLALYEWEHGRPSSRGARATGGPDTPRSEIRPDSPEEARS